ncbi:bacterial surface protein [Paenibacillus sp. CGMCC 1.18879]|uniref:bacterial surface protein n=1 Tax=Paenibacillus sp. CGMCC 1.18879 TaxID=2834466 RepID=UPI001CA8D9CC|nr:bacterial surface protein [Paenibacillus sp. CGMCC 1.18879]MBY9078323.1 bacterial surface protein [Paenibacillus sp. CGMCC 1.18879]
MKKIILPVLMSLLLLLNFAPNTFAATMGEPLLTQEEGWQRIDDNADNIQYIGTGWGILTRSGNYYQGTRHNSSSSKLDDKIRIVFKGTKLRIISSAYPEYSNDLRISIDGVEEHYSQTAPSDRNITLTYEKTGLENKIHIVEIRKVTQGTYQVDLTLDAIDIDSDGELLDPGYTEPSPEPTIEPTESPSITSSPTTTPEPTATPTTTPSPTPEQPTGDRAILVVTMNTGLEKEFDLPMSEINAFLNWYDSASGSSRYGIDKHDNNKGPFSKRTDYVIFDKILTFEVSEYTAD